MCNRLQLKSKCETVTPTNFHNFQVQAMPNESGLQHEIDRHMANGFKLYFLTIGEFRKRQGRFLVLEITPTKPCRPQLRLNVKSTWFSSKFNSHRYLLPSAYSSSGEPFVMLLWNFSRFFNTFWVIQSSHDSCAQHQEANNDSNNYSLAKVFWIRHDDSKSLSRSSIPQA